MNNGQTIENFLYNEDNHDLEEKDNNNNDNKEKDIKQNINEKKNIKEYKFLLLGIEETGSLFIIKTFFEVKDGNSSSYNSENIKYEISTIDKNKIEKSLSIFNGIIFIYNKQKKEILNKIIDDILKIEKIFKDSYPTKFFPKIIMGNKKEIINILQNKKYTEKEMKNMNMYFMELLTQKNIGISYAAEKLIKLIQINNNYKKFILSKGKNEKEVLDNLSKYPSKIKRCLICNHILEILIDKYSNLIYLTCKKCNNEKKYTFEEYEKYDNNILIKCFECKKNNNKINLINFCSKCNNYICNSCSKKHFQKENKNKDIDYYKSIIFPYNLMDFVCTIHDKMYYNYCSKCKTKICPKCEIESHMNHEKIIFDEPNINEIIATQRQNLKREKQENKKVQNIIEDCLNSLRNYLNNLILFKEKEINIKEKIINELEMFKYDDTLINNVQNLYQDYNDLFYNLEESWDKKLNNIFEFFKEPIKIEKIKLCIKENLKGPFNLIQNVNLENNNNKEEKDGIVTDLIALGNYISKNYFAVSFNNGLLKIYNDDFAHRIPIMIIKEFEPNEGINSLYKSLTNILLLVGNSKIKKIIFSEDYKEYKIINEIEIKDKDKDKDQLFKGALELESLNLLIITDNYNNLIIYDNKNEKKIDVDIGGDLSFIDKISEKKIIFQISQKNLLDEIQLDLARQTISNDILSNSNLEDITFEEEPSLMNNSISIQNETNDFVWKILEFDMNLKDIKIKKNFVFKKNMSYLGKINKQLLLFYNSLDNKVILFDLIYYVDFMKIPFNSSVKPIISYSLTRKFDYLEFLILCEGGFLTQCAINLKIGFMYIITKIKVEPQNININNAFDSNNDMNEIENKNKVVKIIELENINFLIITYDNSIYNLKKI